MIWLLRHGEAADGTPDADRPLTERGEAQARAAGAALAAMGVSLDACLTSPKVRAADTARLACEFLNVEPQEERRSPEDRSIPRRSRSVTGRRSCWWATTPTSPMAVHTATGAQVRMKKGGLAGVERGELKVMLRPAELRLLAGH